MTRTALPDPIFSPRLTTLPEGSVTAQEARAEALTVLPLTLATLLEVASSNSHSHAGDAAATTTAGARR